MGRHLLRGFHGFLFILVSVAPGRTQSPRLDTFGDPLPNGALFRCGSIRFRHADGVNSSALSPDGKLLATAAKTSVAVWDVVSGRRVHLFRDCGIADGFSSGAKVAFSPDGRMLAHVCDSEVAVRVWDVGAGKQVRAFGRLAFAPRGQPLNVLPGDPDEAYSGEASVQFTSDGKGVLLCGRSVIVAFDIESGQRHRQDSNRCETASLHARRQALLGVSERPAQRREEKPIALFAKDGKRSVSNRDSDRCQRVRKPLASHRTARPWRPTATSKCAFGTSPRQRRGFTSKLPRIRKIEIFPRRFVPFCFLPMERSFLPGPAHRGSIASTFPPEKNCHHCEVTSIWSRASTSERTEKSSFRQPGTKPFDVGISTRKRK